MAAINRYPKDRVSYNAPPDRHEVVVPSNTADGTADFAYVCRAIYVGVGGNVAVVPVLGSPITYVGVPAGAYILGYFKRVNATNTTATNMIAVG